MANFFLESRSKGDQQLSGQAQTIVSNNFLVALKNLTHGESTESHRRRHHRQSRDSRLEIYRRIL